MALCRPTVASKCFSALHGPLRRSESALKGAPSPTLPFLSKFMALPQAVSEAILTPHPAPLPFFLFFLVFGVGRYLISLGKSA